MNNDKKQTAVEWLQEQLNPDMRTMQGVSVQSLLEYAKAMEKEQIIESIISTIVGSNEIYDKEYPEVRQVAEQYYNETYKQS
jgi:ABC-type molybdenum transport system ATPase subunit/photorepair protein PhrA